MTKDVEELNTINELDLDYIKTPAPIVRPYTFQALQTSFTKLHMYQATKELWVKSKPDKV